jgi:hypothetical protein
LGHFAGGTLLTFEGRAGYALLGAAKVEGRLTLRLPASFRLAGAASFDPALITTHDPDGRHVSATLERVLGGKGRFPNTVCYLGYRLGVNTETAIARQENLVVAGVAASW